MPKKIKFCEDLSANTNTADGSKFGRLQKVHYHAHDNETSS